MVRVFDGAELPIRRSRGYSPYRSLPVSVPPTLAVGADLKNPRRCRRRVRLAQPAPRRHGRSRHAVAFDSTRLHLGDVDRDQAGSRCRGRTPGYRSARLGGRNADTRPIRPVQHHHAHIAAVMAKHGLDGTQPVIRFAFDGTGYGPDGAIWGGEVLLADYRGYRRLARLKVRPTGGGDVSVARPYRMALAHLWAAGLPWDCDLPPVRACPDDGWGAFTSWTAVSRCVPTSSMGRLFDAVALAESGGSLPDEAQAAIELEVSHVAQTGDRPGDIRYVFDVDTTLARR